MKIFDLFIDLRRIANRVQRMRSIVTGYGSAEQKYERVRYQMIEIRDIEARWPDSYLMRMFMAFCDFGAIEEGLDTYEEILKQRKIGNASY